MSTSTEKTELGLYEKAISNTLSWEEKFDLARQTGFDFLELSVDKTEERLSRIYDAGFAKQLRRAMDNTGFSVRTMALTANRGYPLGSEDNAVRSKGLELVRRAVDTAYEAGIRLVHLAAYDDHGEKCNEHTLELFGEAAYRCARMGASSGVMLAFETMDTGVYADMSAMVKLIEDVKSPFLQCYADIGNLTANGYDPAEEFKKGRGHIVGMHLKDAQKNLCRDVVFGTGIVDFDKGLKALFDTGYNGMFVAEMWSYDKAEAHNALKPASEFLRNKLVAARAAAGR